MSDPLTPKENVIRRHMATAKEHVSKSHGLHLEKVSLVVFPLLPSEFEELHQNATLKKHKQTEVDWVLVTGDEAKFCGFSIGFLAVSIQANREAYLEVVSIHHAELGASKKEQEFIALEDAYSEATKEASEWKQKYHDRFMSGK